MISFRSVRLLAFALLFGSLGYLSGCGGSVDQHAASSSTGMASGSKQPLGDTSVSAKDEARSGTKKEGLSEAPGTMQLPSDVSLAAPPNAKGQAPDPLAGGFELPPMNELQSSNPTVVAQRPVIDEPEASAVTLQPATVDQVLQRAREAGKVCVLDFWSLGCGPCLKEFPGLVALHKQYGDKLICVSINCDYDGRKSKPAETYRERAEAFLTANGATFKNYLCTTPSEDVYQTLKTVSIPVVMVLTPNGQTAKVFSDGGETLGFTYAKDVAPLVQSLLENAATN